MKLPHPATGRNSFFTSAMWFIITGRQRNITRSFFEPYERYPGPIFAIAGNHDADVYPLDPNAPKSLEAFIEVFCDTESRHIPFAASSRRNSNIQPNVYWTLNTPLADIIGMYSNVPRFGTITPVQKEWFIEELKTAAKKRSEKALIFMPASCTLFGRYQSWFQHAHAAIFKCRL